MDFECGNGLWEFIIYEDKRKKVMKAIMTNKTKQNAI